MGAGRKVKSERESLERFLKYVLGHRPDEFGLFTDDEGYVPLKELLQALHEEEGWRGVREGRIRELLNSPDFSGLEMRGNDIRVSLAESQLNFDPPMDVIPPKLLYHAARRKAYPAILEHGLRPGARPFIPLSPDKDMAMRIGRRRDRDPVLLTILAERAHDRRIVFYRPQEHVYLVESLPPDLFTGPPLPKEKEVPEKKKKKPVESPTMPTTPGSFFLDADRLTQDPDLNKKEKRKRSDVPDWKRAARRERQKKNR
jgi:putative RNA 2'-phosphotransferase